MNASHDITHIRSLLIHFITFPVIHKKILVSNRKKASKNSQKKMKKKIDIQMPSLIHFMTREWEKRTKNDHLQTHTKICEHALRLMNIKWGTVMNLVSIFLYTSQSVVLDDKIHIFYEFDNVCMFIVIENVAIKLKTQCA